MKIGEFAQLCHTNISLLHYYQKTGLLFPDYVDPFTGCAARCIAGYLSLDRISAESI